MKISKEPGYWKKLRTFSQSSASNSPSSTRHNKYTPNKVKNKKHNNQNSNLFHRLQKKINEKSQRNSEKSIKYKAENSPIKNLNRSNTVQNNFSDQLSIIISANEKLLQKRRQNIFEDTLLTIRSFIGKMESQSAEGKILNNVILNNQTTQNQKNKEKSQAIVEIRQLHEKYCLFKYEILKSIEQEKLNVQKTIQQIRQLFYIRLNKKCEQIDYLMNKISELEQQNTQLRAELQPKCQLKQTAQFYQITKIVSEQPKQNQGKFMTANLIATFGQMEDTYPKENCQISSKYQMNLKLLQPQRSYKIEQKKTKMFNQIPRSANILKDNSWEKAQILKSYFNSNLKNQEQLQKEWQQSQQLKTLKKEKNRKVDYSLKSETFCKLQYLLHQLKNSIKEQSQIFSNRVYGKENYCDFHSATSRMERFRQSQIYQISLNQQQDQHIQSRINSINNKIKSSKSCHHYNKDSQIQEKRQQGTSQQSKIIKKLI